jgi:hypothetical protein
LATSALKTGVSSIVRRIYNPTATSRKLARNGMRHPYERKASSLMLQPVIKNVTGARATVLAPAAAGIIAQKPRLDLGACSDAYSTAPAHSPPAANPCRMRITTMRIGAITPICAAVGISPISSVARPISSSVMIRVFLRPTRSPKCPNSTLPKGRATKATPSVANVATVPPAAPSAGKNTVGNTSAAAKP